MDFKCDLYIYADVSGGYTCHVASSRRVFPPDMEPYGLEWLMDNLTDDNAKELTDKFNAWMRRLSELPCVPIELDHAGETFNLPTGREMAQLVRELRALGYICPEGLEEALEEEDDAEE
jgi:hypothetical protein